MSGPISNPDMVLYIYTPTPDGLAKSAVNFKSTGPGKGDWHNPDANDGKGEGGTYERVVPPPDNTLYKWRTDDGSKTGWFDLKAWNWGYGAPGGAVVGPVRQKSTSPAPKKIKITTPPPGSRRLKRLADIEKEIAKILQNATWGTSADLSEKLLDLQEEKERLQAGEEPK